MKRILIAVLGGIAAGLLVLLWGWSQWTGPGPVPVGTDASAGVQVRIERGSTWEGAAASLEQAGLLKDARVLRLGVRLTGQGAGLRAGLYELPFGLSPRQLLEALVTGPMVQVRVTLVEGWDCRQMASALQEALGLEAAALLAAADSVVGRRLPELAASPYDSLLAIESRRAGLTFHRCEGFLAPDTYHFAESSWPGEVAAHLVDTQLARLAGVAAGADDPQALLTLASIVEAETRKPDERALVAAVYTNRMDQGWKLEADPTVAFALDRKGKRLFHKHLEVDSAFNTYRRRGLPLGPIGNPGPAAIEAAARPDPSCEAMFFVADGQGGHVFSRTVREHGDAVRRYRELRARREQSGG